MTSKKNTIKTGRNIKITFLLLSVLLTCTLISPAVAAGLNLIANQDFESGTTPWTFYTNGKGTFLNDASGAGSPHAAHITISQQGTNVQLYQTGLALEPNTKYKLSFRAYSNTGHDVSVSLQKHGSPYTNYGLSKRVFNLGTSWSEHSVEFTTAGFSTAVKDGRLMFWLAPYDTASDQYYFDDVVLTKVTSSTPVPSSSPSPVPTSSSTPVPSSSPSFPSNPGFESGTSPWTFYTNGKGTFLNDASGAGSPHAAHITISQQGTNVQLYQAGLALEPNTKYKLSFKAYSNTGHDVSVSLQKHGSPYTNYGLSKHVFNLGTSWSEHSVEFITSGFSTAVKDGRLMFWLAPYDTASDQYYFDDVVITKVSSSTPLPTPTSSSAPQPAPTPIPAPQPAPVPISTGKTYYVALNGNDNNPGTEAQPWRTIQKAADTAVAGYTVYVKEGTYKEQITIQNSGSAGKYITFSAYPGNAVIIDGTGISMDPGYGRDGGLIQIWGKSYIKVTGFIVINSGYAGLYVNTPGSYNNPPSHDIIFEGNTVKDSWAAAIMMFGRGSSNAENYVARNNIIIRGHIGGDPMAHETLSVGGKISNFEISGNTIKDSFWGAIDAKDGVYNGKIFGNTCITTEYSCVYIDGYSIGANNIDVFNNVVHDMKNVGTESSGFNVNSEQGGPTTNIRFYNNLVYNNPGTAMRMAFYNSGTEGRVDRITITSNTFYNNGIGNSNRGGISLERNDATNTVVRNNIIFQNNGFSIRNSDADAIIDHNLETNPLFVNPTAGDFRLQSNSPAIDKGSSTSFVPSTDFVGKPRPLGAGYDIGSFEYLP